MPGVLILQRLEACDAPVDVQPGGLVILEPEHHTHAVSFQLRRREHYFVLMGTSQGSVVIITKIAAFETSGLGAVKGLPTMVPTNVDYMVSENNVKSGCQPCFRAVMIVRIMIAKFDTARQYIAEW